MTQVHLNRRLGWALIASGLTHGAVIGVTSLSLGERAYWTPMEQVRPLSVRLVNVGKLPGSKTSALPKTPDMAPSAEGLSSLSLPKLSAVRNEIVPSIEREQVTSSRSDAAPAPTSHPGVSVSEELYQQSWPLDVHASLIDDPSFVRDVDLQERAEPLLLALPSYPAAGPAAGNGWVRIAFFLDEEGQVVDVIAVRSSEGLQHYAGDIATMMRDSRFTPGKVEGRPVKSIGFYVVRFAPIEPHVTQASSAQQMETPQRQ